MITEEYLGRSRLFRRLKRVGPMEARRALWGASRQRRACWARHLEMPQRSRRSPGLDWEKPLEADRSQRAHGRAYLRYRAGKLSIQCSNRAALKRLLSVLRDAGMIEPAAAPPITQHEQIFDEFADYLRKERGLTPKSIIRHLPVVRRCLREVCPEGDLGKISQKNVSRYVERHARDQSAESGKAMCWALRAISLPQRVEPTRPGRLCSLHQAMEVRQPANLSVRRPGSASPRWLRSNDGVGGDGTTPSS